MNWFFCNAAGFNPADKKYIGGRHAATRLSSQHVCKFWQDLHVSYCEKLIRWKFIPAVVVLIFDGLHPCGAIFDLAQPAHQKPSIASG
ncbi:hypothetical protein [Massilia sp. DWR3-1-1]|uniref:hypothetical protein n=1 Tax=Massilia sp. DWR3-1-1 TaxID=2804559 RepID=UPI003CF59064